MFKLGLSHRMVVEEATPPKGLESPAQYQNITAELLKRGYGKEDIIKILGGNLVKIMEKVQSVANYKLES